MFVADRQLQRRPETTHRFWSPPGVVGVAKAGFTVPDPTQRNGSCPLRTGRSRAVTADVGGVASSRRPGRFIRTAVFRCLVAAMLFGASLPLTSKLASELSPFKLAGLDVAVR